MRKTSRLLITPLAAIGFLGVVAAPSALAKARPTGGGGGTTTQTSGYSTPVVVSGVDTGEPGIDVSPTDGAIYINAPSGLGNVGTPSYVWKSANGGASWSLTDPGLRTAFPGGGDSDISIDKTGKLFMTDLWIGSATVSSSADGAKTWLSNPLQGTVVQDRQWIAASSGGVVYHATHQIPSGLVVSKSVDGGVTFPISTVAATPLDQTGCICPPGNLIAAPGTGALGTSDRVGLIYATSVGGVNFAHSSDGGLTYTNSVVGPASNDDTEQAFPVVADAGNGHLVAVWMAVGKSSSVVKFSSSTNWGTTWTSVKTIVSGGTSVYPWVAASGGKVVVSLYHTSASGTPGTVAESATWFEKALSSTDGGASFSGLSVIDPKAVKSGPICTSGTGCNADRELLDFQSVTLDNAGKADFAWTRSIDGNSDTEIRFAHQL